MIYLLTFETPSTFWKKATDLVIEQAELICGDMVLE